MPCTKQLINKLVPYKLHRVHVRRTDKVGTEASYHGIDEYMLHVDEYFTLLEKRQKVERRKIYLATDDPGLLTETRQK